MVDGSQITILSPAIMVVSLVKNRQNILVGYSLKLVSRKLLFIEKPIHHIVVNNASIFIIQQLIYCEETELAKLFLERP